MTCSPLSDPPPIPVSGGSAWPSPKLPPPSARQRERRPGSTPISQPAVIKRPRLLAARAQYFAATASAAGWARRRVADTLLRWGAPELVDDAVLVASELVTNAFTHAAMLEGAPTCRLVLKLFVDRLAVEVWDPASASAVEVRQRAVDAETESGRGLEIVAELCGGRPLVFAEPGHGKTVVAVIPRQRPSQT
ncbi:ATP-binding protein [Catenulispora sp. NL8]|uniref:ATP-binding protein n=1 Tax=Catenulispora pinistramenti TaxID=2705254 RepID=A0ABS5KHZ0_9ACTN|nr:ATP-binding protein [Catenulispora pinistramenti]